MQSLNAANRVSGDDEEARRAAATVAERHFVTGRRGEILDGRYELVSVLGAGGMGEVWRARHVTLGKTVAVKILRVPAPAARERLLQEARVLASLRHDALVEVHDFGETASGCPYFVMEMLDGESLAIRLDRERRLAPGEAVGIALAVARGLSAAHGAGVVHRDVKPENVLLVGAPGAQRPKLIDFGIALAPREGGQRLTLAGTIVGTPEYMAPEMIHGEDSGPSADVWGLAVTLYEMIAGTPPFVANDMLSIFRKIVDDPLPFPRDVPFDGMLFRVLAAALRKSPRERTATMGEFASELAGWSCARGHQSDAAGKPRISDFSVARERPRSGERPAREQPGEADRSSQGHEPTMTLDGLIRRKLGDGI